MLESPLHNAVIVLLLPALCARALWPATWYASDDATFAPGTTALQILCELPNDACGQGSGGLLGDINHDGRPDMAVAAPSYAARGFTGRVYVVFGQPPSHAWPAQLRLAAIASDPLLGFVVDAATGAWPAGDVNGDGIDDFAVRVNAGANAGKNLYVSGHAGNWSAVDAATATGVLADSTWTTGDFDGDGRADWVSTVQRSGLVPGMGWNSVPYYPILFSSHVVAPPADTAVMALCDGVRGTAVVDGAHRTTTLEFTSFQFTLVNVGDIDGDFCDDAVFTDTNYDGGRGVAAVLLGRRGPWENVTVLAPQSTHMVRGVFESDHCGSAAPVGDVNGDSFGDFIVSCSSALVGYSYLLFGSSSAWAAGANTSLGAIESGSPLGVMLSAKDTAAALGDVNADGCGDMALGATIVFGRRSGSWQRLTNTSADGTHAVAVDNIGSGQLRPVGDINGDGADDIVLLSINIIGLGRLPSSDFSPYITVEGLRSTALMMIFTPTTTLNLSSTSFRDPEGQPLTYVVEAFNDENSRALPGFLRIDPVTLLLVANVTRRDQCGTWNLFVSVVDPKGQRSASLSTTLQLICGTECTLFFKSPEACGSTVCKWCRDRCIMLPMDCPSCNTLGSRCSEAPGCFWCEQGQRSSFCAESKAVCINLSCGQDGCIDHCEKFLSRSECLATQTCHWDDSCETCLGHGSTCGALDDDGAIIAIIVCSVGGLLVVAGITVFVCLRYGWCKQILGAIQKEDETARKKTINEQLGASHQYCADANRNSRAAEQMALETEPQRSLQQPRTDLASTEEVPEVLTEPVHRELCLHEQPECRFTELGGRS
eukprot:m51a1_g11197 hypothetical protein (825) ;mRNA; r:4688-7162